MGRKRLGGVSKTYHIRVTSSTERDLFDFIEAQMSQGKSFKDIVVLFFNFYQSNGMRSGGLVIPASSGPSVEAVAERVLQELEERWGSSLESRFDSAFRVLNRGDS